LSLSPLSSPKTVLEPFAGIYAHQTLRCQGGGRESLTGRGRIRLAGRLQA
jgi:hypothetical protein